MSERILTEAEIRQIARDEARIMYAELRKDPRDAWMISPHELYGERIDQDARVRFWSKVDRNGPVPKNLPALGQCWVWTASKEEDGYGRFKLYGDTMAAHRVAYAIENGHMDSQKTIDHLCENHSCVRPSHLEAVSMAANVRRAVGTPTSINRQKEKCDSGHPFDEENTAYFEQNGRTIRKCKTCTRDAYLRHKAERKSRPALPKPDREVLAREILEFPFTTLAVKYGRSDNQIRNWARSYGLDVPKGHPAGRRPKVDL